MMKRSRFARRASKELRADPRSYLERELAEQILAGTVGLTRPQWAGPRTPDLIERILAAAPPLPWKAYGYD
jgi:hypothetical protein